MTKQLAWNDDGRSFQLAIASTDMSAIRTISKGRDGKVSIHNDIFRASDQGTGLGTKVLGRQVEQASKLGVDSIKTYAARQDGVFNGYYTWPRLGYDATIPARVRSQLPAGLTGSRKISDLMQTQQGRDFWKDKGVSASMKFDLKPGSLSRRTMDAYLGERKARGK